MTHQTIHYPNRRPHTRRLIQLTAFVLSLVFFLAACSQKSDPSQTSATTGETETDKQGTSAETPSSETESKGQDPAKRVSLNFRDSKQAISDQDSFFKSPDFQTEQEKIAKQVNRFAAKFRAVLPQDHVVSPLSYYLALAAVRPGLSGAEAEKLNHLLIPEGMREASFNQHIWYLLNQNNSEIPVFKSNMLVLGKSDYTWQQTYVDTLELLGAKAAQVDFQNADTYHELNQWIAEQTQNLINPYFSEDRIKQQIAKENQAWMILNALYFNGKWKNEFLSEHTKPHPFQGDGGTRDVPMMNQKDEFLYYETDKYQAISIPYSNGAKLKIVLPKEITAADQSWQYLNEANQSFEDWQNHDVKLTLPRWNQSVSLDLHETLNAFGLESFKKSLGKTQFFEDSVPLAIDTILQRIEFRLDEAGTEAAAVTEIGAEATAAPRPEKPKLVEMTVERPFVFSLEYHNFPLFQGSIRDIQN